MWTLVVLCFWVQALLHTTVRGLRIQGSIMTVMGNVKVNHRSVAVPSHEIQDGHFTQQAAQMANGQKNRIFLDCVTEESITRAHIMTVLRQYLSMNLIWIDRRPRRGRSGRATFPPRAVR